MFKRNEILDRDLYKIGHWLQLRKAYEWFSSYMEARNGAKHPYVYCIGLSYLIQKHYSEVPSLEDIKIAEKVTKKAVGFDILNTEVWEKVNKLGYYPMLIKGIPEGTKTPIGVPQFIIEPTEAWFASSLNGEETKLMRSWYISAVTTRLMILKERLKPMFEIAGCLEALDFSVNGFEARSATSGETSDIAGMFSLFTSRGSDNIHGQHMLNYYYQGGEDRLKSVWACYDDETEVLTENGFKLFKDSKEDEKVAQYNDDGSIDFVIPTFRYADKYKGDLINFSDEKGNILNLTVTPNHKMVLLGSDGKLLPLREASEELKEIEGIPLSGVVKGELEDLSFIDKLRIAFQADGSFSSRKESYTGEKTGSIPIGFSLKREDKVKNLDYILSNLDLDFSKNKYENGYYSYRIAIPTSIEFKKDFSWIDITKLSRKWILSFFLELCEWDGTHNKTRTNNMSYLSIDKNCVEKVQTLAHLCGGKATFYEYIDKREDCDRKVQYRTSINFAIDSIKCYKLKRTSKTYDGIVYCVGVPSKKLVVRKKGAISICGNTEHSCALSFGPGEGEYDYVKAQLSTHTDQIKSIVIDTYSTKNFINLVMTREDIRALVVAHKGKIVLRNDSGDIITMIQYILDSLANFYGTHINNKGFTVLNENLGVMQADGVNPESVVDLYEYILDCNWSPENLVVGGGTGLMFDELTRDFNRNAIKPSVNRIDGELINVNKVVASDPTKGSKPGILKVDKNLTTHSSVDYSEEEFAKIECIMVPYYNNGEILINSFDRVFNNLNKKGI